jgi:phosphate transport system permease protein
MINRSSKLNNQDLSLDDLNKALPLGRTIFTYGMTIIAFVLTGLALLPLVHILLSILRQGLPQLTWQTLTSLPAPIGVEGIANGFGNAIIGTLMMVGIASAISIPFGLMTGIYLSEFGKDTIISSIIRFITTVLTGIPSVIIGVFAYAVIVLTKKSFSAVAGGFALSILMLPVIALTTEESLKLVPLQQRLASAALGANRFQTTFKIVVSHALPGVTTGVLLAVARAAGETAPLIFTALFSDNWPEGFLNPTPSLSVLIYNYANSPFPEQNALAWTASVVLVGLIVVLSVLSRLFTRRK